MLFERKKVFISGAFRDFGKTLAMYFAQQGAELFVTVRGAQALAETTEFLNAQATQPVHVYDCDLVDVATVQQATAQIRATTEHMDIVINNAAMWLEGSLSSATDSEILHTINSGLSGSLLLIKHLEPLMLESSGADLVNIISMCGKPNHSGARAHEAFYAMKQGQSGLSHILTERLKVKGIRVISLYPPNFENIGDDSQRWNAKQESHFGTLLTSRELLDTVAFALSRPRGCMMNQIFFEDTRLK